MNKYKSKSRYRKRGVGTKRNRKFINSFPLSFESGLTTDRLTYSYRRDQTGKVTEVTTVTYDILVEGDWITIVYYDSTHDPKESYLHKHIRVALQNPSDTPTLEGVKRRGNPSIWLTWAINDIKNNFQIYKKNFLKRSNLTDKV